LSKSQFNLLSCGILITSTTTFSEELQAAMEAIETTRGRGWDHLWLEWDSSLVVQTCTSHDLVPW